jgi:hypothetical protein
MNEVTGGPAAGARMGEPSSTGKRRIREVADMTRSIEIKMTRNGYEVTTSGRTMTVGTINEALECARTRMVAAAHLRDLSERCE